MSVGVLSGEDILGLLDAVAHRLEKSPGGEPATIVVVGGSFMALHGLRAGTADVDTITRIDDRLRKVIEDIAAERDLRPDWLNDRSAAFAPIGLDVMSCTTLFERRSLIVLGPPAHFVFLMKLFAARSVDYDDMVALWPVCSFGSAADAVSRFYAAYPHVERDPHLVDFVQGIASQSGGRPSPE
ncbi:MAG TPA: hypothetical protein VM938_03160 [Acidimicrobiales bacterium]|nr:hypothetical protein [Acidimicrobiales bacterium]